MHDDPIIIIIAVYEAEAVLWSVGRAFLYDLEKMGTDWCRVDATRKSKAAGGRHFHSIHNDQIQVVNTN